MEKMDQMVVMQVQIARLQMAIQEKMGVMEATVLTEEMGEWVLM